jgi:hypothetical protein
VARVGSEVILFGEVMGDADVLRVKAMEQYHLSPAQLEKQIELELKRRLKDSIETKLKYLDAKNTIPPEGFSKLEKKVGEHFDQEQVEHYMKLYKVQSRQELEDCLRRDNTSLDMIRRNFAEHLIAREWVQEKVKVEDEVTVDQMLDYYRQHGEEFEHPSRSRWQQLTIRFDHIADKAAAWRALAALGNQVYNGTDFAEVARSGSDGATAREGGLRNWTTKGSLVSAVLDRAIFSLPIGQLSPILEDEQGFHIVQVLQRENAHRTPFSEAQNPIREKIRKQREEKEKENYLAKLRQKTPVWTVFDGLENRGQGLGDRGQATANRAQGIGDR